MKVDKFIHVVILLVVFLREGCRGGIEDNLVESTDYPHCEYLLKQIPLRRVVSPEHLRGKDVQGKWVSQSCETRPGPVHVIRSYVFGVDGKVRLTLHQYFDAYCRKPKLSVVAEGHLAFKRSSLVTPGATEAEYYIEGMSLVPHSPKTVFQLRDELNKTSCPPSITENLKQRHLISLFKLPLSVNEIELSSLRCVPSLFKSWNELQLARLEIESGSSAWNKPSCRRKELFLGDLHSDPKRQKEYRPTAYQVPLLNVDCVKDCPTCSIIMAASSETPPALVRRPRILVPPLLQGSWASRRCEVQRHGLFLTRKLSFKPDRPRWNIKQRYFYDPSCGNATYTILASGTYKKVSQQHLHQLEGDAFDMIVKRMTIIPDDKNFAAQLNRIPGRTCGISGLWRVNKGQDVTPTGGCRPVGLKVPSKEPELLQLQVGNENIMLLSLGQTPTWPHRGGGSPPRPTSWGPPLERCSPLPEQSNHLKPQVGARIALAEASDSLPDVLALVFLLCAVFIQRLAFT